MLHLPTTTTPLLGEEYAASIDVEGRVEMLGRRCGERSMLDEACVGDDDVHRTLFVRDSFVKTVEIREICHVAH